MLCVLLCAGHVFASCTEDNIDDNINNGSNNTEQPGEDDNGVASGPLTGSLEKVNWNSATFTGCLAVPADDIPFSQVMVCYSDAENFNINDAQKVSTTTFDADQKFTILVTDLKPSVKYKYCLLAEVKSEKTYGTVRDFTPKALAASGYTDLSATSSANCYIISQSGSYCFPVVRGNASSDWLVKTTESKVLWESFGTNIEPNVGDIIKSVNFEEGYISFDTANSFKEGNAVIAAKDASGIILWSWHIWLTDEPQGQEYYNNAGTMMDRNLGATSATPGDVGTLGLAYQWGRKDPFLDSSSSTITWPSPVTSNSSCGTIAYAIANPLTFIQYHKWDYEYVSRNYDWCYTGSSSVDYTRWTTSENPKSIYDPCPPGWRVPDGGEKGVWSKALGSSSYFEQLSLYDSANEGINFSGKFGAASTIWYPSTYGRNYENGKLFNNGEEGPDGYYWSASPFYQEDTHDYSVCELYFNSKGGVQPTALTSCAYGLPVRCIAISNSATNPDEEVGGDEPEAPAFAAGQYWIMGTKNGTTRAMQPLEDKNYGYASSIATVNGASFSDNVFTFEAVEGGFTIKDVNGKYYYQDAGTTFSTFNVGTDATKRGCVWIVTKNDDETYAVINAASGKHMRYAEGAYTSFGAFAQSEFNGSVAVELVAAVDALVLP